MAPGGSGAHYRAIFDRRSPEAIHQLALIKRFLERVTGDDEFKAEVMALAQSGASLEAFSQANDVGLALDGLLPLMTPIDAEAYAAGVESGRFALAAAWRAYTGEMLVHRAFVRDAGACAVNPAFDIWRNRQISRCSGELGASAGSIVHPVIAFELSDGCSVGCWFCGISAAKFKGAFPYAGNEAIWRGVLEATRDFFGEAAETGFCYWATDPIDNPDYARFIEDFYHVIGSMPQTTTAAALRNLEATRKILALFDKYRCITNRFSILNRRTLRAVHATFTPDELMGVELVMQQREGNVSKASAGRVRSRAIARGEAVPDGPATTIACVTGFLVNMVLGRVQLVTPTRASDRWPNGYWIIGERYFDDAAGYAAALKDLADAHMTDRVQSTDCFRLRQDVSVALVADGLELSDSAYRHDMKMPFGDAVAAMLAEGTYSVGDALCRLVLDGADFFQASAMMQSLFVSGLLDEDPMTRSAAVAEPSPDLLVIE
ncbi:MAG: radical SAM family RiPP maturation amino acid epimerase [Pseudomonadota bacterium]